MRYAGSRVHLAKMLGISVNTIMGWSERGAVSKKGAKVVANHPTLGSEFPLERLRPDMEGEEA